MREALNAISQSWPFYCAVLFLGWFPMFFAFLVINSSRQFVLDRQGIVTQRLEPNALEVLRAEERWPVLSVLVAARDEEVYLERCLQSVLALQWPALEVVAVDDGSHDHTTAILDRYERDFGVIVLRHATAKGKAASIDEAFSRSTGGIVLVIDADAELIPELGLLLASQLEHHSDIAAVTGNPRVLSTTKLIEKLQAIEFSATVAAQRRSHSSWGRISTLSGICTMFRRDALEAVGGFDPLQPTEDIEMTWRLQAAGWRVAYEPAALLGTHMPSTLASWIAQRRRWVAGLVCALRVNVGAILRPRNFAVWPLLLEGVCSLVWCHLLMVMSAFWFLCLVFGARLAGNAPLVGSWGILVTMVCIWQVLWGIHLDRASDHSITKVRLYAPLFPLFYWFMMALAAVSATLPALFRRLDTPYTWQPDRPE